MGVELSLTDRVVAVVGGGGGGIGTAVCDRIAQAGGDVMALTDQGDHGADTVARVEQAGRRAVAVTVDVTELDTIGPALDQGADHLGPIDDLVTVVGGAPPEHWHRLLDYPVASLDHLLTTNLRYVLVAAQHVARQLVGRGQGGAMVHISSIASRGQPLLAGYGAAKAGLESLTRTMAAEWGRHGIRVNAVAPSTVNTPRSGRTDVTDPAAAPIPAGRRGLPDDIAMAVLFLLSDHASYISGQTLVVDGGAGARPGGLDDSDLPAAVTNPAIRARFEDG
ncbi:MAG: SDR family oxidoreductase [Acidimicrobiia bacterium]|nr:SDR family oxidoreductase [Acidimicrobiia bacterium]